MIDPVEERLQSSGNRTQCAKKVFYAILWALLLCAGCFVSSVVGLMHLTSLSFQLSEHPDWNSFFRLDVLLGTRSWWVAKIGHFVGFAIEEVLLYRAIRKRGTTVACCILFAIITEILQIPFGRDGRLYDVLIDASGVLVVWWYQSKEYYKRFW